MGKNKNVKINSSTRKICNLCNPQKYLKFNFSFVKENGVTTQNDILKLLEKTKFLSSEMYRIMIVNYSGDKQRFIEDIPVKKLDMKVGIPKAFREIFPIETNEKYSIFRLYCAGTPSGTANPRIIGMIKNTIFYIFYIDWKGSLYSH